MNSKISRFIYLFALGWILWLLLVGHFAIPELVAGLIVSLIAASLALGRSTIMQGLNISVTTPWYLIAYLAIFLLTLIRANLDMARRVISRKIPLNPQIIKVTTSLSSDLGKLVLANSITLTPGTLSVDVIDDEIIVHWIDCPGNIDRETATREIAQTFEKYLKGFLR